MVIFCRLWAEQAKTTARRREAIFAAAVTVQTGSERTSGSVYHALLREFQKRVRGSVVNAATRPAGGIVSSVPWSVSTRYRNAAFDLRSSSALIPAP